MGFSRNDLIGLRGYYVTNFDPPSRLRQTNQPSQDGMAAILNSSSIKSLKNVSKLTENDKVPGSKFEKDPENYTVEQLKRWLKCRGLKQSGKRSDLLTRVRDCVASGSHHVLDPSIDDGKWYEAKLSIENQNTCIKDGGPDPRKIPVIPDSAWKAFPTQDVPQQFNYGHVHYYALESLPYISFGDNQSQTLEDSDEEDNGLGHMTDKPFRMGRKYVDSDYVHDLTDNRNDDYYFLRAHVWHSMSNDHPHNVLVILSTKSGAVIHANCEPCKASKLGRCSHVVAVLLYLVDHIAQHGYAVSTPCTSKECTWNKGKKRQKNPQRLSSTDYHTKRKRSQINVIDFDPRPRKYRKVTKNHINNFVSDLESSADAEQTPMWTTQLYFHYNDYPLSEAHILELQNKVNLLIDNITPESLQQLENTDQQSLNDEWHRERSFRLTASKCSDAVKLGHSVNEGSNNAAIRCKKFISNKIWNLDGNNYQSVWMARGLKSESAAITKYEEQTKQQINPS
jgi:hypothetical protein